MTIEVLLTQAPQRGLKRVGDFRTQAPYVVLYSGGEKMIVQMPIRIASRNTILWDQKDFSVGSEGGAAAMSAARNSNSAIEAVTLGNMKSTGEGMWEDTKNKALSTSGQALGVQDLADFTYKKAGKAINPNKELMFQGMGFRVFTFEWEFVPTNAEQADQINDFIYTIQYMSSTDLSGGANTYFTYPDTWQILIYPQKYMPLIMPCYVTEYNIDYGGVGRMVFHEGGAPVQVNISITFTENQMHTRSQIKNGGYWG